MTRPETTARRIDIIASHGVGRGLARVIVTNAERFDVPLSILLAVIEHESSFLNVFGHDGVANPIKSPLGGLLKVTKERYQSYLRHRRAGKGAQGVGVTQLTAPSFQDRADELGGCWTLRAQVQVGAELLGRLIAKHGRTRGLASYNAGEAGWRNGLEYARTVEDLAKVWHTRLVK
jgi:hypothetical protein